MDVVRAVVTPRGVRLERTYELDHSYGSGTEDDPLLVLREFFFATHAEWRELVAETRLVWAPLESLVEER